MRRAQNDYTVTLYGNFTLAMVSKLLTMTGTHRPDTAEDTTASTQHHVDGDCPRRDETHCVKRSTEQW
ncbi:hypothetical protein E2C01_026561 [Portunus trituberculatus]|uniref:Uncharacterized protein n=1 Tax=Portunus trituberculatus TaxID=210409 RepID=A0A5B7EIM6_PORTR|nr:hypothetical protein [Portunus trituberculatus]